MSTTPTLSFPDDSASELLRRAAEAAGGMAPLARRCGISRRRLYLIKSTDRAHAHERTALTLAAEGQL